MRIVCDNCSAKYQISDDKVRNKVFKIRCKKCSHVIVVKAGAQGPEVSTTDSLDAGADEPTRVVGIAPPESKSAGGTDAIWYVVVNREQVGPLTPADVERRYRAGEVDADTFTWAEGMSDWVRLSAISEFSGLFAGGGGRPGQSVEEPASVFSAADDGDEDVMVSRNAPVAAAAVAQPASLFGGRDREEDRNAARVSDSSQLLGQRNENSVLFSLDSLANAAESRAQSRAPVTNTGGAEGSGLIDISALMGGGGGGASARGTDDAFGGSMPSVMAPSAPAATAGPMPSLVRRRRSNTPIVLAIVACGLLIGGGVLAAVMLLKKEEKPAVATGGDAAPATISVGESPASKPAEAKVAEAAPGSVAAAPASEAAPASGAAPESVAAAAPKGDDKPAARPAARPAGGAAQVGARPEARRPEPEDEPPRVAAAAPEPARPAPEQRPAAAPRKGGSEVDDLLGALDGKGGGSRPAAQPDRGGPAAAAPAGADPMLPEQLDRNAILRVAKQRSPDVQRCKDRQPGASGIVKVKLVIGRNGKVSSAQVADGEFRGSPVGSCVEGVARGFTFPQFSGEPMSINLPFAL